MTNTENKDYFEKEFVIRNKLGLHARPAALFVKAANNFKCEVEVEKEAEVVNGKSIMGIMTLAVECGTSIIVKTRGVDARQAMNELEALIQGNFGEAE